VREPVVLGLAAELYDPRGGRVALEDDAEVHGAPSLSGGTATGRV
jgi:hypothetical protein